MFQRMWSKNELVWLTHPVYGVRHSKCNQNKSECKNECVNASMYECMNANECMNAKSYKRWKFYVIVSLFYIKLENHNLRLFVSSHTSMWIKFVFIAPLLKSTGSIANLYWCSHQKNATSPELVVKVKMQNLRRFANQIAEELVKPYKIKIPHYFTQKQQKVRLERAKDLLRLAESSHFPNRAKKKTSPYTPKKSIVHEWVKIPTSHIWAVYDLFIEQSICIYLWL